MNDITDRPKTSASVMERPKASAVAASMRRASSSEAKPSGSISGRRLSRKRPSASQISISETAEGSLASATQVSSARAV